MNDKRISVYDTPAIDQWAARLKVDREQLRRLRSVFFRKAGGRRQALAGLDQAVRETFGSQVDFESLLLESQHESLHDGATKLIFRTGQGYAVESVILRIATGRTTLCVSSQVGCAARCEFCATGKMGMAVDLTPFEIVDQLVQARRVVAAEGRVIRNVVFMGMGEPLHNERNLHAALEMLFSPALLNHAPERTLVSSVGVIGGMLKLAARWPRLNQALSLHSAREQVRQRLIPLAIRYELPALRRTLQTLGAQLRRPVMIEYLMLAGINDEAIDLTALCDFLVGLNVHVNLIPYNAIADAGGLAPSGPERIAQFAAELKDRGYRVTTRHSLGTDVAAACGQLVQHENRELRAALAKAGAE